MSKRECDGKDVMHLGPQVGEDGSRLCVRHKADHTWQKGVVKPVKEGQPLDPKYSCLSLDPRKDGAFDVNVLMEGSSDVAQAAESSESSGPAMVNSENFKTGWDRIFGKATVGVA